MAMEYVMEFDSIRNKNEIMIFADKLMEMVGQKHTLRQSNQYKSKNRLIYYLIRGHWHKIFC